MTSPTERDEIEIFIQGEGISSITLVRVRLTSKIAEIVELARKHGLSAPEDTEVFVLLEDSDQALTSRRDHRGCRTRGAQPRAHPSAPLGRGDRQLQ